jgi:hypothetical protein
MRNLGWPCVLLAIVSVAFERESSACWWRRHCRCHQCRVVVWPLPHPSYGYGAPVSAPQSWYAPPPTPQATGIHGMTAEATVNARGAAVGPTVTFVFQGKKYLAVDTNERGESEEKELPMQPHVAEARRRPSDGEHFAGTAREAAKTSFARGVPQAFDSPGALLDSILRGEDPRANDSTMRAKLNEHSPRGPDEQRNATVTGFLYATKKETDNDFHLLIGDNPNGGSGRFMTAEVSGLPVPTNATTPQFERVRNQYKEFFRSTGQNLPGSSYRVFPEPVPVTITGSIFFDVDHKIGEVHSRNALPESVWEVHPVSDLVFGSAGGQ